MAKLNVSNIELIKQCLEHTPKGVKCAVWDSDSDRTTIRTIVNIRESNEFPLEDDNCSIWEYGCPVAYQDPAIATFDDYVKYAEGHGGNEPLPVIKNSTADKEFKVGDLVYAPNYTENILTVSESYGFLWIQTPKGGFQIFPSGRSGTVPHGREVWHATPENRIVLEYLYGKEFERVEEIRSDLQIIEELLKSQHAVTCVVSNDPITEITEKIAVILSIEHNNVRKFIDGFGLCWKYARAVDISKEKPTFIDKGLESLDQI